MRSSAHDGPSGLFPLWLGVSAFAVIGGLWLATDAPVAPEVTLADLGVIEGAEALAPGVDGPEDAPPHGLVWTVTGRAAPDAATLGACLRARLPEQRPLVLGSAPHWTLTFGALPLPQSLQVEADGALALRTPVVGDRRGVTLAHVATAACLQAPGARLRDPELGRDFAPGAWPEPGPTGGAPVEAFVIIEESGAERWRTQGLARLGRAEVGVAATPGAEGAEGARRLLLSAAATMLASEALPPVLLLPGSPALTLRPAGGVAAWPAQPPPPPGLSVLVQADGALFRAPPAQRLAPRTPPSAPPVAATSEPARPRTPESRPARPPATARSATGSTPGSAPARPTRPPRTPPTRPAYLPDYL